MHLYCFDSASVRYDRDRPPPRRDRQNRGGFGGGRADRERRSEQQDDTQQERPAAEQADQGTFDRPVRDGFSTRPPRYERAGFRGRPRGFNRGGFGERSERSGFDEHPSERTFYGGDHAPRRGGFRGRRGDRSGFGDRSSFGERNERTDADDGDAQDREGADDQQGRETSFQPRERGGFGQSKERQGFEETAERSGFDDRGGGREFVRRGRGGGRGFGRGRGGFDRPGKRDYERHTEGYVCLLKCSNSHIILFVLIRKFERVYSIIYVCSFIGDTGILMVQILKSLSSLNSE